MGLRLHADELARSGGLVRRRAVASRVGGPSLLCIGEEEIAALAQAGTVATLLRARPGGGRRALRRGP